MLILLMLAGLVLSSAIPYAFGVRGWMFAAAYCTMQIGRSLYMVWASWGVHPARARSFLRIVFWLCLSLPQDGLRWLAFATCFLGSAALWWLYFDRSEEHTSELPYIMRISYAVF